MYNKHKFYVQKAKNLQNKRESQLLKNRHKYLTINQIKLYFELNFRFKLQFFRD